MKHSFFAILCGAAAVTFSACVSAPGGTGDPQLDAEIRNLQFHEQQISYYGRLVDSLGCIEPRDADQEQALREALKLQDLHLSQWQAAHQRAEERAQGDWKRICPLKRSPGVSCTD